MGIFSRKPKVSTEPVPLGAITAAGTTYSAASYQQTVYLTLLKQNWQPAVFDIYDTEGHLYYAASYIGNALARINLVAAKKPTKDAPLARPVIIEDGPLADAVNRIESPNGGQAGLLKKMGQNIFLVGEVWMIPRDWTNAAGETVQGWEALSVAELQFNGTGSPYKVLLPGAPIELLPPDLLKIRIWKQHPRFSALADAGPRSCLDQLELIVILNRAEKAVARSRMAGSGILGIPQELVPPAWQNQGTSGNPMEANPLYQALAEAAIAPLSDEAAPSSVMPTLLVGPGDHIKNIKHIEINRTLDFAQTESAIDNAIDQIASTLELPKEILKGIGGETTHWTAWAVREDTFQAHIQPLVEMICEALTRTYLKQALQKLDQGTLDQVLSEVGATSVDDIIVWYDASQLIIRPDKGDKALAVHDRFGISDEALRRETGFSEDDAPSEDELSKRYGVKMVLPEMAVTGELPPPEPEQGVLQPAQPAKAAGPNSPKQ